MKCPKCQTELIYIDVIEDYYDTEVHDEKWHVICPAQDCDFEGKLWQNYRLESEEWATDEENDN